MSRLPNPELYPYLSRKLASAELNSNRHIKSEASDESLDAVDAAAVMLSLKNGPRYRQKKEKGLHCQVITTSPSQDHTYSAADSVDPLGTDEAFESDDER
jgi:forkhead box protein N